MFFVDMLKSRKFWVVLFALFVIIMQATIPEFSFDEEVAIGFTMLIVSYIVGVSVDPGGGFANILKSRKFWAAVVGLLFVFFKAFNVVLPEGLDAEAIVAGATAISSYILSVAFIDNAKARAKAG